MSRLTSPATAPQHEVRHGRRGIGGRPRRLPTRHLWLPSRVVLGHLKLDAVAGEQSPADTCTTALPGRKVRQWSEHVGQTVVAAVTVMK